MIFSTRNFEVDQSYIFQWISPFIPFFQKSKKEKKLLKEVEKVKKESSAIKRCCCTILWCNKSMSHTYESFTYLFPLQVFSFLLLDQLRSFHFLWYLARTCPFFRSTFQGSTDQNRAICWVKIMDSWAISVRGPLSCLTSSNLTFLAGSRQIEISSRIAAFVWTWCPQW